METNRPTVNSLEPW